MKSYADLVTSNDNPANRLHEILTAFETHSGESTSVTTAWSRALSVEPVGVSRAVSRASNLLNEVEQAVLYLNQPRQKIVVATFMTQWSMPFFPVDRAWNTASSGLISSEALVVLGGLGDTMSSLSPEGTIPDDKALNDLRSAIEETITAVRDDVSISDALRTLMLQRLHDISWAIDHLEVAGPSGVKAATERLVGAILLEQHTEAQHPTVQRVMKAAAFAWTLFVGVTDAQDAIEGWGLLFKALPPGLG